MIAIVALVMAIMQLFCTAGAQSLEKQSTVPVLKADSVIPDIVEFMPKVAQLSSHLDEVQKYVEIMPHIPLTVEDSQRYEKTLDGIAQQIDSLKRTMDYDRARFANFKLKLFDEKELVDGLVGSLKEEIRLFSAWEKEWQTEQGRWGDWRDNLLKNKEPEQLLLVLTKAHGIIENALELILGQLDSLLKQQARGVDIVARIEALNVKTGKVLFAARARNLQDISPSMFSLEYFNRFNNALLQPSMIVNLRVCCRCQVSSISKNMGGILVLSFF